MEIAFPDDIASPAGEHGAAVKSSEPDDRLASDDELSTEHLDSAYADGSDVESKAGRKRRNVPFSEEEDERKRLLANCQERQRANQLSRALDKLRGVLPREFMPLGRKPSKIRTLRLAISYIRGLNRMLCDSSSLVGRNPQVAVHCRSDATLQQALWSPSILTSPQCYLNMTSLPDEGYSSFSDTRRLSDSFVGLGYSPLVLSPCSEEITGLPERIFRPSTANLKAFTSRSLSPRRRQTTTFCLAGPITPSPNTSSSGRRFEPLPEVDDLNDVQADVATAAIGGGGGGFDVARPRFSMDQDDAATFCFPSSPGFPPPAVQFHTPGSISFSSTPAASCLLRPAPRFGLDPEPLSSGK